MIEDPKQRIWRAGTCLLAATLLPILSAFAAAPNDPASSSAGDVLICDFEDAADRDYDGWPDGWVRRYSRELPEFLKIGIVPESGETVPQVGQSPPAPRRAR